MPQPLENRIAAALEPRARAATVADLVTEITGLIVTAQTEHDALDATSKSVTAADAEADAAAEAASKLARRIVRLTAQREQLEARHAELMNSERRKQQVAEHAAIKARRDQLVADLKEHWPAIAAQMVALLHRIERSDAEIASFQRSGVPSGCEWLESAESIAREVPANFYSPGGSPILRLTKIKLPGMGGDGFAWPDTRAEVAERTRLAEQQRLSLVRAKEEREREAAKWKRFAIAPPSPRDGRVMVECYHGLVDIVRHGEIRMTVEQAEAARAKGCTVERLKPGQSVGMPAAAAVLA